MACLCIAAGINVAVTRTAFASSIILVSLSGELNAAAPVLAASLVSIFVTYYMPFIRAQQGRYEVLESQLHLYKVDDMWDEYDEDDRRGVSVTIKAEPEVIGEYQAIGKEDDVDESGNESGSGSISSVTNDDEGPRTLSRENSAQPIKPLL